MVPIQNIFVRFSVINGMSYLALNYELYEINDIGQLIWESIDGQKDVEEISLKVASKYKVNVNEVETDVQEFVNSLHEKGLIEAWNIVNFFDINIHRSGIQYGKRAPLVKKGGIHMYKKPVLKQVKLVAGNIPVWICK